MPDFKSVEPVKYDRRKHNISFKNAFNGILLAFRTQPNFRFHSFFFVLINIASFVYKIDYFEYVSLVMISAVIFSLEMVNTSIEALGDEIAGKEYRKLIGVAKDVAAGAVLLAVLFALYLGGLIFLTRFLEALQVIFETNIL